MKRTITYSIIWLFIGLASKASNGQASDSTSTVRFGYFGNAGIVYQKTFGFEGMAIWGIFWNNYDYLVLSCGIGLYKNNDVAGQKVKGAYPIVGLRYAKFLDNGRNVLGVAASTSFWWDNLSSKPLVITPEIGMRLSGLLITYGYNFLNDNGTSNPFSNNRISIKIGI